MKVTTDYKHTDFERILEISDACYAENERPPRKDLADMISVSDVFLAKHPDDAIFGDAIFGFAIVKNVDSPYLWSIAIKPYWQGNGYGKKLLEQVIIHYTRAGEKEMTLHVNTNNRAHVLYFNNGFRTVEVIKNYYHGADALLMRRPLK